MGGARGGARGGAGLGSGFGRATAMGFRGGSDAGFLSATLELSDALHHAARQARAAEEEEEGARGVPDGEERGVARGAERGAAAPCTGAVLAIHQGIGSRGADLRFLSQYPHELEVVFPPLTRLEVLSARVSGASALVDVRPSPGLAPATLEGLLGRRRQLLEGLVRNCADEVSGALRGSVWAPMGVEWRHCQLAAVMDTPAAEWHAGDASLPVEEFVALAASLAEAQRRATSESASERLIWAREATRALPAVGLATAAAAVQCLGRVGDEEGDAAREAATRLLLDLPCEPLGIYCAQLVDHCAGATASSSNASDAVRSSAIEVLAHLKPSVVSPRVHTLVANLCGGMHCAGPEVRRQACNALVGRIEPVALLASNAGRLRPASVELLAELSEEELAMHAPALVANLLHATADVRRAALEVISSLPRATLRTISPAIASQVADADEAVRSSASDLLILLSHDSLEGSPPDSARAAGGPTTATPAARDGLWHGQLLPALTALLGHSEKGVQSAATRLLRSLGKAFLGSHAPDAARKDLKRLNLI